MTRLLLLAVATSLSWGCAFSAVNRPDIGKHLSQLPREETFDLRANAALDAARSAAEAVGYEIQAVTEELGQVRTETRSVAVPQLCDCGTWNMSPVTGTGESVLVIRVTEEGDDQSKISLEHTCSTQFAGQNLYGATTRRESYQCASKGTIEADFWSALREIIKARKDKN